MSRLCLLSFAIFLYGGLVRADYTIDDSNYSILKFSENPSGPVWGPFGSDTGEVLEIRLPNGTMQTIDATRCYDGTYTYAACSTANNCAVQFSFTGSGITIYVLQAGPQGMSASLSIDSAKATTATLDAPTAPQYYTPHVTLFNVQNILSGTHTAVMTVLDWNGGFSGMMLDYIDVNQAVVANPSTSSSPASSPSPSPNPGSTAVQSPSSTPSPTATDQQTTLQQTGSTGTQTGSGASSAGVASVISVLSFQSPGATVLPPGTSSGNGTGSSNSLSSTPKHTNIAAIAGGAAGGAVGLLAILCLALCCFRRRRHQYQQALNERPSPLILRQPTPMFTTTDIPVIDPFSSSPVLSANRLSGSSHRVQSWTNSETSSTPKFTTRELRSPSPATNFSHTRIASSGNNSATSVVPASIGVATVAATSQDRASTPTQPNYSPMRPAASNAVPVSYLGEKSRRSSSTPTRGLQQDPIANPGVSGVRPNTVLTDEQADFVNGLFNNNVPAPVVARVLERMITSPQGASGTGVNDPELRGPFDRGSLFASSQTHISAGAPWLPMTNDNEDTETTLGTAPPSYYHVPTL